MGENQAAVLNLKAGERNLVAGGDEKMEADEKILEGEHKNTKAGAENGMADQMSLDAEVEVSRSYSSDEEVRGKYQEIYSVTPFLKGRLV